MRGWEEFHGEQPVGCGGPARRCCSRHTRSFSLTSGQYTLVTNRPLSACAAVATRGSIDTAVPFDPATVEIVTGAARDTVGLQVRQLLFFGGNPASESFHAAMIC